MAHQTRLQLSRRWLPTSPHYVTKGTRPRRCVPAHGRSAEKLKRAEQAQERAEKEARDQAHRAPTLSSADKRTLAIQAKAEQKKRGREEAKAEKQAKRKKKK